MVLSRLLTGAMVTTGELPSSPLLEDDHRLLPDSGSRPSGGQRQSIPRRPVPSRTANGVSGAPRPQRFAVEGSAEAQESPTTQRPRTISSRSSWQDGATSSRRSMSPVSAASSAHRYSSVPQTDQPPRIPTPTETSPLGSVDELGFSRTHSSQQHQSPQPQSPQRRSTRPQSSLDQSRGQAQHGQLHVDEHNEFTQDAGPPEKRSRQSGSSIWSKIAQTWLIELSSWVVSLLSLVGLVLVLSHYNGQALPQWPSYFTLNAVVAIFSLLTRAYLVTPVVEGLAQLKWLRFSKKQRELADFEAYDSASRGAWGSLQLMRFLPSDPIACFGAAIVVLAIAIDPFLQQILNYPLHQLAVGTSVVPIAHWYEDYTAGDFGGNADHELSIGIKGAMYNSLFGGLVQQEVNCPTGNCTWPQSYSSLAVCSKCVNMTRSIHVISSTDAYGCKVTMPNGAAYTSGPTEDNVFFNVTTTPTYGNSTHLAAQFYNATIFHNAPAVTSCDSLLVFECSMSFCINTYQMRVESGKPEEELVSSWLPSQLTSSGSDYTDLLELDPPADTIAPGQERTFHVGADTMFAFTGGIPGILSGNGTASGSYFFSSYKGFYGAYGVEADTPQALYNAPDLPEMMRTVARSMTLVIRSGIRSGVGQTNTSNITGTAWDTQPYVEVRWPWISLLVVLEAASLAFLVAVIVRNRQQKLPLWKSAALPILRARVGGPGEETLINITNASDMEVAASAIKVKLKQDERGTIFSDV